MLLSTAFVKSLNIEDFVAKERFANGRVCPLCGCIHVVRNGHRKDGTQRYVCKDFRGQGIGSALINISIEWAKHKNLHGLMLETQDNNLIACKFYHNCGFKIGSVDTMLYANFENNFEKAVFWYLRF